MFGIILDATNLVLHKLAWSICKHTEGSLCLQSNCNCHGTSQILQRALDSFSWRHLLKRTTIHPFSKVWLSAQKHIKTAVSHMTQLRYFRTTGYLLQLEHCLELELYQLSRQCQPASFVSKPSKPFSASCQLLFLLQYKIASSPWNTWKSLESKSNWVT